MLILFNKISSLIKMVTEKSQRTVLHVGVLALQGGFSEHISHLYRCAKIISEKNEYCSSNIKIVEVRTASEVDLLDGIILPGGETTAMSILMERNNQDLLKSLRTFVRDKPVFGTCAGLIMLANAVKGQMELGQLAIGGIDITVRRNAYGSQLQSFEAPLIIEDSEIFDSQNTPMIFIRAPGIESIDSDKVKILAKYKNTPVAVRQNNLIATSFHPELTNNLKWHMYFMTILVQGKSFLK